MSSPSPEDPDVRASQHATPEPSKSPVADDQQQSEDEQGDAPEEGEVAEETQTDAALPPLPDEPVPGNSAPPLPSEPVPQQADDGWDCQWDATSQSWFFHNRFTGKTQWENPRVPADPAAPAAAPAPPSNEAPVAGGYNPAIHGDYDPDAWYAQGSNAEDSHTADPAATAADIYAARASFNRFTGNFQADDAGPGRHSDEAKSKRQMNAFFDVEAAANAHDGRSLKAERSHQRISKSELKAFKEKRRAKKEEKRRAWLRD